jgi:hypothetical protein
MCTIGEEVHGIRGRCGCDPYACTRTFSAWEKLDQGNGGGGDGRGWLGVELKGVVASAVQCSGWRAEISSRAMLLRSVI